MFFFGLGIILAQATRSHSDPGLLVTGLVMMGVPVAEAADLFRNRIIEDWDEEDDKGPER